MEGNEICRLCGNETIPFSEDDFFRCVNCNGIYRKSLPDPVKEKQRYDFHENKPGDGYTGFVSPLIDHVSKNIPKEKTGLDFGCGPDSVITRLLSEKGFVMQQFDPFYANDREILKGKYDFIIACEVAEHFHHPGKEFETLKNLLHEKGELLIMTHLHDDSIPFEKWYYKNDFTHVFFYTRETFEWIKIHYNFSGLDINGRFIRLIN